MSDFNFAKSFIHLGLLTLPSLPPYFHTNNYIYLYMLQEFIGLETFKKYYLPASVEARFFRFNYESKKNVRMCLKLELYGSSKGNTHT